jgi:hypothetical protein
MLRRLDFSTVAELPLLSGRRADIVALASDGTILIVEIKSSVADFRADSKWQTNRTPPLRTAFPNRCISPSLM